MLHFLPAYGSHDSFVSMRISNKKMHHVDVTSPYSSCEAKCYFEADFPIMEMTWIIGS